MWPLAAQAQQLAMPMVGFVGGGGSADANALGLAAFRKGLGETGYVDGRNVMVEYHWLEGQYDCLPALMADLVRRRVAVIAPFGVVTAIATKAATATIPIVFMVGDERHQSQNGQGARSYHSGNTVGRRRRGNSMKRRVFIAAN